MLGSRRSVAYDLADLLLGDANPLLSARRFTRRASKSTAYDMDMDQVVVDGGARYLQAISA